jgi:hypothetical protein
VYTGVSVLPGLIILNAKPEPLPIVDPTNTFASSITQGLTLDIYAYVEASLEFSPTYIKKLTS